MSTEAFRSLSLKYCVEVDLSEKAIDCGFIGVVSSYSEVDDVTLIRYLYSKSEVSMSSLALDVMTEMTSHELRRNIKGSDTKARMQGPFISYVNMFCQHG